MTLYHGSPRRFEAFEIGKGHENGTGMGYGIYLTDSKERAKGYAGKGGVVYKVSTPDNVNLLSVEKMTLNRNQVQLLVTSIAQQQIDTEQYPYILSDWGEPTSETSLDQGNHEIINQITDNLMEKDNDVDVVNSLYQELGGDNGSYEFLQNALDEEMLNGAERDFDGTKEIVIFNPNDVRIDGREEMQAEIQQEATTEQKKTERREESALGAETAAVAEKVIQPTHLGPIVGKAGEMVPTVNRDYKDFWDALNQHRAVEDFWYQKITRSVDLTMAIKRVETGTPRLFATITRNANKHTDWQLTKFDKQEQPISHIEFNVPKNEADVLKLISELPSSSVGETYRVEQLNLQQKQQEVKLRPHEQAYVDLINGKIPSKTDGNLFLAYDAGATLKERYSWRMRTIDRIMPYSHGKSLERLQMKHHELQKDMLDGKQRPLAHETAIVRQATNSNAEQRTVSHPTRTKENGLSI